jgi:hypothetical protein
MEVYIYFVQWKPYCAAFETPKAEYIAVITPYLMKKVVPGRRIPGPGGITKGFATRVWMGIVNQEILDVINSHLQDINLYIRAENNSFSVITDSGIVATFEIKGLEVPSANYYLEVHKMI